MMPVAILAGGLATRLRPITEKIPKSLVEISGRPFIFWQLEMLRDQGIKKVVLCVGHYGAQIQTAIDGAADVGIEVMYSFDGPVLLGTGGALRRALPMLGDRFFVLYGDSYLTCSFAAVQKRFEDSAAPALMTVLRNDDRWDKSNVVFQGGKLIEYNKRSPRAEMAHIDYGLGILSREVFAHAPVDTAFDLADIYQELSLQGRLAGFEVDERFYEIGSPQGIKETERYLSTKGN